jgi:hypothetical protein
LDENCYKLKLKEEIIEYCNINEEEFIKIFRIYIRKYKAYDRDYCFLHRYDDKKKKILNRYMEKIYQKRKTLKREDIEDPISK